jgi:hypothetical protein
MVTRHYFFWILIGTFLHIFAHASEPSFTYWMVQENRADGRVAVKLIEEDTELQSNQHLISQQVIFEQIYPEKQAPSLAELISNPALRLTRTFYSKAPPLPLWVPIKDKWTETDEDDYSAWVASKVDTDFNHYTGLKADCADVGLLFRWVYARDHLLPIANTLAGSGKLFGHFSGSTEWDLLPTNADWKKDERFKAALKYLFENTYTHSVFLDLYPTLISPQYVRPGSVFMIIRSSGGHTQTIKAIKKDRGITTLWGNEPASTVIDQTSIIIEYRNKEMFGRWRTPMLNQGEWSLTPATQMPGFSIEQDQQNFQSEFDFRDWLATRVGYSITDQTRLFGLIDDYFDSVQLRKRVTAPSLIYCYYKTCTPTSTDYDNYSTFERDVRLKKQIMDIQGLLSKLGPQDSSVKRAVSDLSRKGDIVAGELSYFNLATDPTIAQRLNADPSLPYSLRWGYKLNSTSNYLGLSQAMEDLIYIRSTLIRDASENTSTLDGGIRLIYSKLKNASHDWGVSFSARQAAKTKYQNTAVPSLYSVECAMRGHSSTYCNLQQLIWNKQSAKHIENWSPLPRESVLHRWGFVN